MKKYIFFAALAAFAVISCNPDTTDESTKVKKTHTIKGTPDDPPVRTALAEDGLTINWEGAESIGVFDGIDTAPNKFDAESAGATTYFSGEISDGATNLLVFYPYQSGATCNMAESSVSLTIPAVQTPVKGGFDPAAAVSAATATTTDETVFFRNFFALLKVEVDIDKVASIKIENTSRSFAGGAILKIASRGISDGTSPSKTVTLKKSDDSALEQGVYYFVVRSCTEANPYRGFTMTVVTTDGATGTRSAVNDLVFARNEVKSIGKLSSVKMGEAPAESRYADYMAGKDIVIGDFTINKATNGDATLLSATAAKTAVAKNTFTNGGVFFLDAAEGASFLDELDNTPTADTYIIANTSGKVKLSIGKAMQMRGGSVFFKDIVFDQGEYTGVNAVSNGGTSKNSPYLVFDNCEMLNLEKAFFSSNSKTTDYGVENIIVKNCRITVKSNVTVFQVGSATTAGNVYKRFVFENNYVYSVSATTNYKTSVFSFNCTAPTSPFNGMTAEFNNNLLYNVATSSGFLKHYQFGDVVASKNVMWIVDEGIAGGDAKLVGHNLKAPPVVTSHVSDNIAFGLPYKDASTAAKWATAESAVIGTMEKITVLETDPFESVDLAKGIFTLKSTYSSYGPQL